MIFIIIIVIEIAVLLLLSRRVHGLFGQILYRATGSRRLTVYLSAVLFMPGTFVHEMSHFMAALFLLVPVGNLTLLPRISDEDSGKGHVSVVLGSVAIAKTDPFRKFLIGIAPVVVGLTVITSLVFFTYRGFGSETELFRKSIIDEIVIAYFVFTVANTMFSSKRDMEGSWIILVLLAMVAVTMWILDIKVNISYQDLDSLFNTGIVRTIAMFMTIPVLFDIIIVAILKKL